MNRLVVWRVIRIGIVLGSTAGVAAAQDSNYWSSAFGTRSQLLGGVVIGSPGDISSVYYNPGALALTQTTELLLAGNAYQYQRVKVDNGSGPGRTLTSSALDVVPSLFAGELPVLKEDRLAYAFLTRRSMDMEINQRSSEGVGAYVPIAAPTFAATEIQLHQHFSEGWYGMTWAHKLSERIGVGVSPFVVVRSQNSRFGFLSEGRNASGDAALLNQSRAYDYQHWSVLARLGIYGVRDSLTWGVTVTTPNLGLAGSGHTEYNTSLLDETGVRGTVVGADYRKDLEADYRSPLGAGAGISFGMGASRVHAAVDWNDAVDRYTVIESPDFVVHVPSGDSTVRMVMTQELRAVLNWGVGIEHRFSATVGGFASYHTDLSGRERNQPAGGSLTRWNLHHVALGSMVHVLRSDLALGVSAAFASQPTPPLPPTVDGTPLPDDLQTHELLVTMLVGWKITF